MIGLDWGGGMMFQTRTVKVGIEEKRRLSKCCRNILGRTWWWFVLEWRGAGSEEKNGCGTCFWETLNVHGDPSTSSLNSLRQQSCFSFRACVYDLRDHGAGERPGEGVLGTLRPIMGAQQIYWCCYISLVPRDRSSTQEHLCTADFHGQRPSWHL